MKKTPGYGDFGNLAKTYDVARKEMPKDVLDYVFSVVRDTSIPLAILDVGCGTGIITRQMAERGALVVGSDRDHEMLQEAKSHSEPPIKYVETRAEDLKKFSKGNFDLVTAFSAFHWFANEEALREISRVLKPGGAFIVVNRNSKKNFRDGYRATLQRFMQAPFPDIKKEYNPKQLFLNAGFTDVQERTYPIIEKLSVEEAIEYIQTTSPWNLVPEGNKEVACHALKKYFGGVSIHDVVEKPIDIVVVSGIK